MSLIILTIFWMLFWMIFWALGLSATHRLFPRRMGFRLAIYGIIIIIVSIFSSAAGAALPFLGALENFDFGPGVKTYGSNPPVAGYGFEVIFIWFILICAFMGSATTMTAIAFTALELHLSRQHANELRPIEKRS